MIAARTVLAFSVCCSCAAPPVDVEDPPPPPVVDPAVHVLVNATPAEGEFEEAVAGEGVRYGDPFTVVVDGLAPRSQVTLRAQLYGLTSSATFESDDAGVVDARRDAPLAGSYEGVDAEGLLWSLTGEQDGGPLNLDVTITAEAGGEDVASFVLHRRFINEGIVVDDVNLGRSQGILAVPEGDGPFPAVLVFGGSEGGTGTGEFYAMYLASLGVAAMGVGYFGATGLPRNLVEVPLEILEEDLALLTADPRVDPERVVVMGGSRGGELALLCGAHFPVVKGVIATVPSGLVWPGLSPFAAAAWTLDDVALPFVPPVSTAVDSTVDDDGIEHVRLRRVFLDDIAAASAEEVAAATIPVEDIAGPVLLLASEDDQLWPSCVLADIAAERAEEVASFCFPDAGHGLAIPGWSMVGSDESFRDGSFLVLGGTAQGNAAASRAADTEMRRFLQRLQ